MLVQGDFGNPIHGVSRQPDSRKFPGQAREQINCRNNLTRGMEGRAGFTRVGVLRPDVANGGALTNAKWDIQKRGDGTNFLAAYDVTRPAFFDLSDEGDIDFRPFFFSNNAHLYYLGALGAALTDPNTQVGVSTLFDTTFITNRTTIPDGDIAGDVDEEPQHIVWLEFKTFQPGTMIKITMSGGLEYKTQVFDSFVQLSIANDQQTPGPEKARTREYTGAYHASAFVNGVPADGVPNDPNIITPNVGMHYNNWVRLDGVDADSVTILQGGEAVVMHDNRAIESIEKIPPVAKNGDIVHIKEGRGEDKNEGYFVASGKTTAVFGESTWAETTAPGSSGTLYRNTMPHVIRRNTSNHFVMEQYEWEDRRVGANSTNPYPSFVEQGLPIQAIGIFQNRLYMTAGEVVALSASDNYNDLWRESAFYQTDADPFEVFADTEELNIMAFADLFDGDLVLFSGNGQFAMPGSITHTYNTARIETVSQYQADLLASPVLAGDNIFFGTSYGSFAGAREFFTDNYTATKRSRPITDHVNDYIPGRIRHMATSTNLDVLCSLNTEERDRMYLYEWRWDDQKKQQQAWSHWELTKDDGVTREFEWVGFLDSEFYAVIRVIMGASVQFELWKMSWDDPPGTHGLPFSVRLDGRFVVPGVSKNYNATTDKTTLTLSYKDPDLIFIEGTDSDDAGFKATATSLGNGVWQVDGDYTGITLIAGVPFRKVYQPGLPQIRDARDVAQSLDRVQFQTFQLRFQAVGEVKLTISDSHGNTRENTFNNRRINRSYNLPSYVPYEGDNWRVPVRKKARELTVTLETDSYVPMVLEAIEWLGEYIQRGRRV